MVSQGSVGVQQAARDALKKSTSVDALKSDG